MTAIHVYGSGGHGKVVADAAMAAGFDVRGFIDDGREPSQAGPLGLPVMGDGVWLEQQSGARVALGIGNNRMRHAVAERLLAAGLKLVTVIHPRATVAGSATLAEGTVVFAGAVVNPDAAIGRGAIINTSAIVEHDCVVGAFAHVAPNAAMGGGSHLEARAWLGIGATLIHGGVVGGDSIIGAGAAVVRNIPAGVVAVGVPARPSHPVDTEL